MKFNGSCLCGTVKYQIEAEPRKFYHCHCSRCRKASGTGHATNIMAKVEKMEWLSGEQALKKFKVPDAERFYNQFCTNCGSSMPRYISESGMVVIPAGTLDNSISIRPEARIFWDSRSDWSCSADQLDTFAELPG